MRNPPKIFNTSQDYSNCLALAGDILAVARAKLVALITTSNTAELQRLGFAGVSDASELLNYNPSGYNLVFEGDALTESISSYYPAEVVAMMEDFDSSSKYWNDGLSGDTVYGNMLADGATRIDTLFDAFYSNNVVIICGGNEDIDAESHNTGAELYANIKTWCVARKAAGFKTIVLTLPPRTGEWQVVQGAAFNALLESDWSFCDAVVVWDQDIRLNDVAYYNGETLTKIGYEEVLAPYVKDIIEFSPSTQLTIPFSDGSSQGVHPSVLYFPVGWAGYKFWMLVTGYKNGDDRYENPHLFASNDGVAWVVPVGISNPITPAPTRPKFNCDPELVYEPELDQMRCYAWDSDNYYTYKILSSDMSMGGKVSTNNASGLMAIVRLAPDNWYAWGGGLGRSRSTDGTTWTSNGSISTNLDSKWTCWHLSVFKGQPFVEEDDGLYHFLFTMYPKDSNNNHCSLFHGTLENPSDNVITNATLVMSPGIADWTNGEIYRCCMVKIGAYYRIYNSACNKNALPLFPQWGIGYVDNLI